MEKSGLIRRLARAASSSTSTFGVVALSIPILVFSAPVRASDGVIELGKECATQTGCVPGDAPGFPITLGSAGSYRLTGPLAVPTDVSAIEIAADGVHIDLAGFTIQGPHECGQGDCVQGSASAITGPAFPLSGASESRVEGGRVRGFSGDCVSLGNASQVEDLIVAECGGSGIVLGAASRAEGNTVRDVGGNGLVFGGVGGVFAHNLVVGMDARGQGRRAVAGVARATAGNGCPDASCTPRGERRFYLSELAVDGSLARSACAPGFHMASLFEMLDPTGLVYDHGLGAGPLGILDPVGPVSSASALYGWVRTGANANGSTTIGEANCQGYTDASPTANGTAAGLKNIWMSDPFDTSFDPWIASVGPCSSDVRVWCIED